MRLSTVLQVSFVGALMFTPAMAEDIQQVHEQALRILRAQEAAPADTRSGSSVREQRETLRRQQAAQAEMRRQQQQEERRKQFEAEQQRRQAVRHQITQSTPTTSNPGSMSPDEMHEKALAILRNTQPGGAVSAPASGELAPSQLPKQSVPQAASAVAAPAPTIVAAAPDSTPSPEVQERARQILKQQQAEMQKAQPAPATVSAPASTLSGNTPEQEALHERALEILRQQTATSQATVQPVQPAPAPAVSPSSAPAPAAPVASAPAVTAPAVTPAPTQAVTVQSTAPAPGMSGDVDLIHEQALRVLHQDLGQPTGTAQALDAKTREIISRQNQEIARQLGTTHSSMPALNSTPTQASSMPQHELAPEMEARAREILRQQMANSSTTAAAITPSPTPATSVPVRTSAANNSNTQEQVQYSRELEQKARQTILNNSQNASATAPTTAPAAAPAPSVTPTPAPAPQAPNVVNTTPAPAAGATTKNQSDADIAAIHAKALDTMQHVLNPTPLEQSNQILSSQKNKREKLNELTDLYKADKLTPAQYHEYRARILAQPQ